MIDKAKKKTEKLTKRVIEHVYVMFIDHKWHIRNEEKHSKSRNLIFYNFSKTVISVIA